MVTLQTVYTTLLLIAVAILVFNPLITKQFKDQIKGNKVGLILSIISLLLSIWCFFIGVYWILE